MAAVAQKALIACLQQGSSRWVLLAKCHAALWNACCLSGPHMDVTTHGASHRGIVQFQNHIAESLLIYRSRFCGPSDVPLKEAELLAWDRRECSRSSLNSALTSRDLPASAPCWAGLMPLDWSNAPVCWGQAVGDRQPTCSRQLPEAGEDVSDTA